MSPWKNTIHSDNPNDIKKSLVVRSAPRPVGIPNGRGAGVRPQFRRLIFKASIQYRAPTSWPRSTAIVADLNSSEAFLRASSFPPATRRALKDCTDAIEGGCDTEEEASRLFGGTGTDDESACKAEETLAGAVDAAKRERTSLASVISPSAMLGGFKQWESNMGATRTYCNCGRISSLMFDRASGEVDSVV